MSKQHERSRPFRCKKKAGIVSDPAVISEVGLALWHRPQLPAMGSFLQMGRAHARRAIPVVVFLDPNLEEGSPELQADQLVYVIEGEPNTFLDMDSSRPTVPTSLAGTLFVISSNEYSVNMPRRNPVCRGYSPNLAPLV